MRPTTQELEAAIAIHGSIRKAAPELGVDERTVRRWMREGDSTTRPVDDPLRLALSSRDAELREVKKEHRQLSEALAKRQEFITQMVEAARLPVKVPTYREATRPRTKLPERSIVAPIFDLQYGQFVRPEDVPFGKGGFTEAIFDARLAAYVEKVERFLLDRAAATNFTELHLVLGGDLTEGDQIFAGQAWQLQKHPIRQVLDLRVKLGRALRHLIRFAKEQLGVKTIAIYCVPGNHGKVGGKRAGATPADYSWDYLVGELLKDELREEPIDLFANEPAGALMFETQEHTFLTIHGDEIKGHAGIPFYGFTRFDGRAMRLAETVYDYTLSGHIHQPATIPNGSGGEFITSGDWVGGNNLSKWIVAASRPQQRILLVARKYGIATDERIYLDGDRTTRSRPNVYNARG